jgi:DNA-binding NtrC family response regulator
VLFADGERVLVEHLPDEVAQNGHVPSSVRLSEDVGLKEQVRAAISQLERQLIFRALEQMRGNVTHTARVLKLSRKGLQLKMKELGLRDIPMRSGKDPESKA